MVLRRVTDCATVQGDDELGATLADADGRSCDAARTICDNGDRHLHAVQRADEDCDGQDNDCDPDDDADPEACDGPVDVVLRTA